MYIDLIKVLSQFANLTDEETKLITSSFEPHTLLKGEYFLKEGEVNRHIGFLHRGLVRYFVYKDGEASTFEFTKQGEFIGDYQSFRNASVSIQNIQAIEDCELLIINYPKIQNIYNISHIVSLLLLYLNYLTIHLFSKFLAILAQMYNLITRYLLFPP